MRRLDGINDSRDTSLSKLREIVKDRDAWHAVVHGIAELDKTERQNNDHKQRNLEEDPPLLCLQSFSSGWKRLALPPQVELGKYTFSTCWPWSGCKS